jgi:hypothetical protein
MNTFGLYSVANRFESPLISCNNSDMPVPMAERSKRTSWPLGYRDSGFESRLRHGSSSLCFYVGLSCVCRGFCDGLISRSKESYRMFKIKKKLLHFKMRRIMPDLGCRATETRE